MKKKNQKRVSASLDRLHWGLAVAVVFLVGVLVGDVSLNFLSLDRNKGQNIIRSGGQTYVSVRNLDEEFRVALGNGDEFVVHGGNTWIPVPGSPVELVVVNDLNCGQACDPAPAINSFRGMFTPALLVRTVGHDTAEGKALISKFDVQSVPAYFFGGELSQLKNKEGVPLTTVHGNVLTEKDGIYAMNKTAVGLPVGKFLGTPKIDLKGEPSRGNGRVKVIEFSDYECPYCKRLHDNNKGLIKRLIDEGKIKYILKDFPLGFHKASRSVHTVANCTLKDAGDGVYWNLNDKLFANQNTWKTMSGQGLMDYLVGLAGDSGANKDAVTACTKNPEIKAEIDGDIAEGRKFGVSGTPALFIGGQFISGAIGPDKLEAAVNAELK